VIALEQLLLYDGVNRTDIKTIAIKEQNPIDCNADFWCAAIALVALEVAIALAAQHNPCDRQSILHGRRLDSKGFAIALEFIKLLHMGFLPMELNL
jgi:hypothetical protein